MPVLACLMHWYESAMFVVPVLAVGGWGWWSARRMAKNRDGGGHGGSGSGSGSAGGGGAELAGRLDAAPLDVARR
jgi:hypothetical protein